MKAIPGLVRNQNQMVDCQRWLNNEMALRREHLILSGSQSDLSGIFLAHKSIPFSYKPAPF